MVNTSNDAWFGDSFAAHQHLEMARTRAREFAKPIARATNNGVTAFVGSEGDVVSQIPQFEAKTLRNILTLNSASTWFVVIGQNLIGVAMAFCLIVVLFVGGQSRAANVGKN